MISDYIKALSHEERHEIVRTYNILVETGSVGNEAVRYHAEEVMKLYGASSSHVTRWMEMVANECYKFYYNEMFP